MWLRARNRLFEGSTRHLIAKRNTLDVSSKPQFVHFATRISSESAEKALKEHNTNFGYEKVREEQKVSLSSIANGVLRFPNIPPHVSNANAQFCGIRECSSRIFMIGSDFRSNKR